MSLSSSSFEAINMAHRPHFFARVLGSHYALHWASFTAEGAPGTRQKSGEAEITELRCHRPEEVAIATTGRSLTHLLPVFCSICSQHFIIPYYFIIHH